jgi:predicted transport protein
MRDAVVRNLPEKTGRTIEEWAELVRAQGELPRKERIAWLKREHALGGTQAAMVADYVTGSGVFDEKPADELVDAQYGGAKAALRPLYERVRAEIEALGPDVDAEPRQGYVGFARGRQFALLQASTATRLDLGLVLPGVGETERLRPAGSFGSGRTTHRVAIATAQDVDAELGLWLHAAYDAAAT